MGPQRGPGSSPVYLAGFVVLGASLTVIGPSLTRLQAQAGVGLGAVSILFTAQALGYLVGSILGGQGYDRGFGHHLFAGSLFVAAASLLFIAWAPTLLLLVVGFVVLGWAAGGIDVGGNTLLVWSRGDDLGPWMNALHLCFGLGALACPLLVAWSLGWLDGLVAATGVIAVVAVGVGGWTLLVAGPRPPSVAAHARGEAAPTRLLAAVGVFFVLYVGLEMGFAGWVYTYGETIDLGGAGAAAALTAVFWVSFTAGRAIAIVVARTVAPGVMLGGAAVLTVAAAALLVVAGGAPVPVWIGTALFGLAVSPQFATMIAFAERHMPITGAATSWFIGSAAVGGLVLPWLIGQLFAGVGAQAMPVVELIVGVLVLAWLAVLRRLLGARPTPAGPVVVAAAPGWSDPAD